MAIRVPATDIQLVYYDLETTGLYDPRQITQIGALYDYNKFSVYVCPRDDIQEDARIRTGLQKQGCQLFKRGIEIKGPVRIQVGLESFLHYLEGVKLNDKNLVLIGHNIRLYDNPILRGEAHYANVVCRLNKLVYCYIDTLEVFRKERKGQTKDYKQHTLVNHYLEDENYVHQHEAVADARALRRIVNKEFSKAVLYSYSRDFKTDKHLF